MSRIEKLIDRFKSKPNDFTYNELTTLLNYFGFIEFSKGKTSGSRVCFINSDGDKIYLHKPHPDNIIRIYILIDIYSFLYEKGLIK